MKQLNIKFLLALLLTLVGVKASAYDIAVQNADGVTIYYNYINNSTELAVTYRGSYSNPYYNEYSGNVVIPKSVTYNEKIYSVTSIGDDAFIGCSELTNITIPNSVTNIGKGAFWYCTSLTSIFIPNSVTTIGYEAFLGCSGLTNISIPNSVTSIGWDAFAECSGLTSITIPNSVTSIGGGLLSCCSGLTSIQVANGNKKYDSRNGCNAIIETESNVLISGCKKTIIPNSVNSIGNSAFAGCSGLTSITIPNSVTSIGGSAFQGCTGLTCINIPNSVTNIRDHTFYGCSGLTSITIPNSVTSIGGDAFTKCSGLTSITIGNSVTSIEEYAFSFCHELTDVYCYVETTPSIVSNAFIATPITNAILHVPESVIKDYKATKPWSYFKIITSIKSSGLFNIPNNDMKREGAALVVYDLQGRRVEQPQRGLYIRNGKKVIIK